MADPRISVFEIRERDPAAGAKSIRAKGKGRKKRKEHSFTHTYSSFLWNDHIGMRAGFQFLQTDGWMDG